jgi:hypothetical protein
MECFSLAHLKVSILLRALMRLEAGFDQDIKKT